MAKVRNFYGKVTVLLILVKTFNQTKAALERSALE